MIYYSHVTLALAAVTASHPWNYGPKAAAAAYAMGFIGGLLPDIDHPKSFLGKYIPVIPTWIYRRSGHRGITHTGLALIVVWLVGYLIAYGVGQPGIANILGLAYATHLAGDFVTNNGIPLYYPLVKERIGIEIGKTGRFSEYMIVTAVFALSILSGVLW